MATASLRQVVFLALAVLVLAGCSSSKYDPVYRRQKLLEIYPLGTTTRADVVARWSGKKPDFSIERPAGGWSALAPLSINGRQANVAFLIDQALVAEKRSGVLVHRLERFWGADGMFSLCYCWFYYDLNEKLVDVEWQYMSD